ncbi:AarF/ABC1/UbiB kinase family protein [Candidatus Woesearchaeota archaeon]|nr:AarF/ABC1/UbiB kinase family protein [Candidatus Woesearchaeota archaeon]
MKFRRAYRDIRRVKDVVNILFKQGLGYSIGQMNLTSHLPFRSRIKKEAFAKKKIPLQERLRKAMEDLGGTFIKFGQLLSIRPDLVPEEYCEEFAKLQDSVKPFPYNQVKEVIEREFKRPIHKIFAHFEKEPVAAASVGQVHIAKLRSGETVAVKAQRPKIDELFESDIDILYYFANLAEKHIPELKDYSPVAIVNEFENYTKKELDYNIEAKNIDIFYKNFHDSKSIKIPKVFWEYTGKKVLTMEYIDGIRIDKFKATKAEKKRILEILLNSFIKQILKDGFFHGDPHPGNIFILNNHRIAFLDFGIVGQLDESLKRKFEDTLIAIISGSRRDIAKQLIELGIVDHEVNISELEEDLSKHLRDYYDVSLKNIDLGNFLSSVLILGTAVEEIIRERASPFYIIKNIRTGLVDFADTVKSLPYEAKRVFKILEKGEIKLEVEDRDIKKFAFEIDKSSNRIAYSMILASLVVAAALLAKSGSSYTFGLPLISLIFLSIAIFVTILLLMSIYKEGEGLI